MHKAFGLILLVLLIVIGLACAQQEEVVTLYYEEDAQVEIISPQGVRVMIDVENPSLLSSPATNKDALCTTHGHSDHYLPNFEKGFPGPKLFGIGGITLGDIKITGIGAAHNPVDQITPENANNYIYLVEVGGLRIAHFGDTGQPRLFPEQLKNLGEVDIAITQFHNPVSMMDIYNKHGFMLMDQVKPKLIIPTHVSMETAQYAAEKWSGFYQPGKVIKVNRTKLSKQTKIVFLGIYAEAFGKVCNLPLLNY